jgi:hypothetical protein
MWNTALGPRISEVRPSNRFAPSFDWSRPMLCVVYALLIIVSLGVIVRRNTIWRDDMTLYTTTLQTNPDAAVIRSNLGLCILTLANTIVR